ncbi:MAG: hypothetical protein V4438_02825 [Patescibacteria group bacterium]
MADGIPCKHCGWQEIDHKYTEDLDPREMRKRISGYKKTLMKCQRFVPEYEEKVSEEALRFQQEAYERQGEARAAWGLYSALVREDNMRKELREYAASARGKGMSRSEIEKGKQALLKSRSDGLLYIG